MTDKRTAISWICVTLLDLTKKPSNYQQDLVEHKPMKIMTVRKTRNTLFF